MLHHTHSPVTLKDRVLGSLLGGALGDAWGGPTERTAGLVPFEIPKRPILSDDTQLTLATCESTIEHGSVDPENLAAHFLRWFLAGRVRGMGSSTLKAMRDLAIGTHWELAESSQPEMERQCALRRLHSCWIPPARRTVC